MFSISNKINNISNLFHKRIYEMFFASMEITAKNMFSGKNAKIMESKNIKAYKISKKRRLLKK